MVLQDIGYTMKIKLNSTTGLASLEATTMEETKTLLEVFYTGKKPRRKVYSRATLDDNTRAEIISDIKLGLSTNAIAKKHGVPYQNVYYYKQMITE